MGSLSRCNCPLVASHSTVASAGVAEVGFEDHVGWVQLQVVVMASGGAGGGAGGDPVGSGAVGEVDLAVRVAPQVDAGEGLAHDPASVGLDPVVVPAQGSVVLQPGGPVLLQCPCQGTDIRPGVVAVHVRGQVGGVREDVGRRSQ